MTIASKAMPLNGIACLHGCRFRFLIVPQPDFADRTKCASVSVLRFFHGRMIHVNMCMKCLLRLRSESLLNVALRAKLLCPASHEISRL